MIFSKFPSRRRIILYGTPAIVLVISTVYLLSPPQLIQFEDSEFDVVTATNVEKARELLAVGFNYVAEKDDIMLFRKPKRFNG